MSDSRLLSDHPIIALRQDVVRMPDGSDANREIVEHFGAVAIVAVTEDNTIPLVKQWRQCVHDRLWELPAGILDLAGEDPLVTAQRELREEIGFAATKWGLLHDMVTSPGFCEEAVRIYLATDLSAVPRPAASGEELDMTCEFFPVATIHRMLSRGEITNGIAIAGLYHALDILAGKAPLREVTEPFTLRPTSMASRRAAIVGPGGDMKHSTV